jgi:hypothetical protein
VRCNEKHHEYLTRKIISVFPEPGPEDGSPVDEFANLGSFKNDIEVAPLVVYSPVLDDCHWARRAAATAGSRATLSVVFTLFRMKWFGINGCSAKCCPTSGALRLTEMLRCWRSALGPMPESNKMWGEPRSKVSFMMAVIKLSTYL